MNIGNQEDYKIALVTDRSVLSTASLRHRVSAVYNTILERRIMPFEKVLIFLTDEDWLLTVLWALMRRNVICVPIKPTGKEIDLAGIGLDCNARYLVTEDLYAGLAGTLEIISIDRDIRLDSYTSDQGFRDPSINYLFYNPEDNYKSFEAKNNKAVMDLHEELDALLSPDHKDVMLISRCIGFSQLVMELIWGTSRGLTLVLDSLEKNETSLSNYLLPEDQFEMDFGLFHFGSYLASGNNKYGLLFDTVRFADKNEFSCVWTPERHFNEFGGLFPNPSVLSAALAAITTHVQIRSGSLVSPLHHAARIAEDWSLVDNLSGGRVAISFASGWQCDDFIFSPENYAQRHEHMMGQIDIVKRLWRGEKVSFKNGLEKEIQISIFPKPVQTELPVWVTVSGKTDTFIDAGKIGANILTHLLWQDPDEMVKKIAAYRSSLTRSGFDPRSRKVAVMVHTYLGKDSDSVKSKVREPLKNYIRTSTQLIQSMAGSTATASNARDVGGRYGSLEEKIPPHLMEELTEIAFNRFFDQAGLLGTLGKAREMIKKLKGYDVDEVAALIDFGLDRDTIMEGLEYLNELRKIYNKRHLSGYPATITHCSLKALENMRTDVNFSAFVNAQRMILTDADDYGKIPFDLLHKVRITRQAVKTEEPLFNSSISEEF